MPAALTVPETDSSPSSTQATRICRMVHQTLNNDR